MTGPTTPRGRLCRSARDRLIDLLGLGATPPLQDLPITVEPAMVTFGGNARIVLAESQPDVAYAVRDKEGQPLPGADWRDGTGAAIDFPLLEVVEETSFRIEAAKRDRQTGEPRPVGGPVFLHARPTIKVGIATGLEAWIRPLPFPVPLIDFAAPVEVEIAASQEGVDYRLVHYPDGEPADLTDLAGLDREVVLSAGGWVRGDGGNIVLPSRPLRDDLVMRVRCLKTFSGNPAPPRQTDLLAVRLPVAVRADRAVALELVPAAIVNHHATPNARITQGQPGIAYRVHRRRLRDAEFRPGSTDPDLLRVPVPGQADVQVVAPPRPETWSQPVDFDPPGAYSGTEGGVVDLALAPVDDDSLIVVEASKSHSPLIEGTETRTSTVRLDQVLLLLTRPNTRPDLLLEVAINDEEATGPITLHGGQPGVRYAVRVLPAGPDLPEEAYVHRRDDENPRLNKGLSQLWLGIDLVVAADPAYPREPAAPDELPPAPPRIDTSPLAFRTKLALQAVKARTGVGVPLEESATIEAPPTVKLEAPVIPSGSAAQLTVRASRTEDRHTLRIAGRVVTGPVAGNGDDLVLVTPALTADTIVELGVADTTAPILVERVLRRVVAILPRTDIRLAVQPATIAAGDSAIITLATSEPGVTYQLLAGGGPLGGSVQGTGGSVPLPTGPLAATAGLRVRASRLPPPEIATSALEVLLDDTATVTVAG